MRLLYQSYDVTNLLAAGENVMGAIVADGWACGFFGFDAKRPGGHYARCRSCSPSSSSPSTTALERLVTDQQWSGATGAIAYADLLMGEFRDAGREPKGWDRPGYDGASWQAVKCRQPGEVLLVADPGPPMRVTEEIKAKCVTASPSGELIVRLRAEPGRLVQN